MSIGSDAPGEVGAPLQEHGVVAALVRVWLPIAIVIGSITVLASRQARPITDLDVWWHLRLGEEFRDGWALADPGSLSPFATEPWVPTQWSLEILASYLVEWVGLGAVVWLTGLGVVLLGVALWRGNREVADPLAAAIATAAALAGTTPVLAPRPQVASLVFLAVAATAWWASSRDLGRGGG